MYAIRSYYADSVTEMFTGATTTILGNREVICALLPKRQVATHKTAVMATISIEAAPAAV